MKMNPYSKTQGVYQPTLKDLLKKSTKNRKCTEERTKSDSSKSESNEFFKKLKMITSRMESNEKRDEPTINPFLPSISKSNHAHESLYKSKLQDSVKKENEDLMLNRVFNQSFKTKQHGKEKDGKQKEKELYAIASTVSHYPFAPAPAPAPFAPFPSFPPAPVAASSQPIEDQALWSMLMSNRTEEGCAGSLSKRHASKVGSFGRMEMGRAMDAKNNVGLHANQSPSSKGFFVLSEKPCSKIKGRKNAKRQKMEEKSTQRATGFNHYSNGHGFWESGRLGVDVEEVGTANTWEGIGMFGDGEF